MLSIRTESPEGAKRPQTGVITPGIVTHYPEALKGRKMVFRAFSTQMDGALYNGGFTPACYLTSLSGLGMVIISLIEV